MGLIIMKGSWNPLPSNIPELDIGFQGGLPVGSIIHLYGESGTGKSTLAMQYAAELAKRGGTTLYMCNDRSLVDRLRQIVGPSFPEIAELIKIISPSTYSEQSNIIDALESHITSNVGLIVVDTITGLYRADLRNREHTIIRHHELNRQMAFLYSLAKQKQLIIIVINEATQKEDSPEIVPVADSIISYWSSITIKMGHFSPQEMHLRYLIVPSPQLNIDLTVSLTNRGIEYYEDNKKDEND